MTRRKFIKLALGGGAAFSVIGTGYSAIEAGWIDVTPITIPVSRLPRAFVGTRIVLLTDIHLGPFTSVAYVNAIVARALSLQPDLILLGGDFIHHGAEYIQPVFAALSPLTAPLGVFAVLGNHDHYHGATECSEAMAVAGIRELTNTGVWLTKSGERLRVAGVGDLWEGVQDLPAALGDCPAGETSLLLSHNPDFAESIRDRRVGLVFSGHTHGGQVVFPLVGPPYIPSRYGSKYLRGLVAAPNTQVFVSRGLGTITPPLRFCCRPEINVVTLT